MATLAVAAATSAQLPNEANPYQDFGDQLGVDTDHTPRAKGTDLFQQVAGAKYGETEVILGSPTAFNDHLYTVAFSEQVGVGGFAGGATCEKDAEPGEEAESGDCVPVLYQYRTFDATHGPQWRKVALPGAEKRGYVGSIAWIGRTGRALAVGGTGTYPRREPAFDADKHDPEDAYGANYDPAGQARAWLYDPANASQQGGWCELGQDSACGQLPADMRGLTALSFDSFQGRELGFAGALGQLWKWENGRFTGELFDMRSPDAKEGSGISSAWQFPRRFRFRVRAIRFVSGQESPIAVAVTAGCCADSPLKNSARVATYGEFDGPPRWRVYPLMSDPSTDVLQLTDGSAVAGTAEEADAVNLQPQRPDSFYSLMVGSDPKRVSVIATPGGPYRAGDPEPPSRIPPRYCWSGYGKVGSTIFSAPTLDHDVPDFTRASLSTARLVAGDGDLSYDIFNRRWDAAGEGSVLLDAEALADPEKDAFRESPLRGSPSSWQDSGLIATCASHEVNQGRGDAVPDWIVGELRSTYEEGLGSRGLLVANPLRPSLLPDTVDPNQPGLSEVAGGQWEPTSAEKLDRWAKSQHYLLPSYGLNAIDVIGDTATGWSVGDHGAILRLDAERVTKSVPEPDPPKLGARRASTLPEDSPYDGFRAAGPSRMGLVPALAARPPERLPEPRPVLAGAPDPTGTPSLEALGTSARQIVMSRDGSEGWAIGPREGAGGVTTLYHFDGSSWSLCDFFGVQGQLDADPACAGIGGLRLFANSDGALTSVKLRAAARVPLERDDDPGNDDEFEVVAVGTDYVERQGQDPEPVVLRYREGRWEREEAERREEITQSVVGSGEFGGLLDVAFSAPDHGWILVGGGQTSPLFRFDGERWINCASGDSRCAGASDLVGGIGSLGGRLTNRGLVAAGDRVYLFGSRGQRDGNQNRRCPAIAYHQRGAAQWHTSAEGAGGSWDPQGPAGTCLPADEGTLYSLTVGRRADGSYEGWAVGRNIVGVQGVRDASGAKLLVLKLRTDGNWRRFAADDALGDYLRPSSSNAAITSHRLSAMVPAPDGALEAFIAGDRLLKFNGERQRWELTAVGPSSRRGGGPEGGVEALTGDGRGGLWLATGLDGHDYFYNYTDSPRRPVFNEVPQPAGNRGFVTAAAAGPVGSLWLGTDSDALYRYDRLTGWARVRVPGWDPGRVVTRTSPATAIALNESGAGVVVGERGRIANIEGESVSLDRAAGTLCDLGAPTQPCGTGRDLLAAAVAPDGSALVAGDGLALLWRPAGGEFRAIQRPDAASQTTITGVSMPQPDRAWLTTNTGFVFRGEQSAPGRWSWRVENVNARNDLLTIDRFGQQAPLRAIAVDKHGRGFAVGDGGVILERREGSGLPWRRLDAPFLDNFTAVALPLSGGGGALVGAEHGAILTWSGERFELARSADWGGRVGSSLARPVVGLALLPGLREGQVEAWAAVRGSPGGDSQLLHYSADPGEPLLRPDRRAEALPDTPVPRAHELAFAAFGHTRCLEPVPERGDCQELTRVDAAHEVYTQQIVDEIAARAGGPGGPVLALFTGDVSDNAGIPPSSMSRDGRLKMRRFSELVADRLEEREVPLLGAIGAGDLSGAQACSSGQCLSAASTSETAGENLAWRRELASRRKPWGDGPASGARGLEFRPVRDGRLTVSPKEQGVDDVHVDDPDGSQRVPELHVPTGGARTHYAVDVVDTQRAEGQEIARLVFADTSLRSLSAADPLQHPLEPEGGQAAWLERVLCVEGGRTETGEPCTRRHQQQAIVVSNAPTYSYGPGQEQTQTDAAAFESILLRHKASLVVSGRIGWNGLYWATAAGVHEPCPGGSYQTTPPEAGRRACAREADGLAEARERTDPALRQLSRALEDLGAPPPPAAPPQATGALNESGLLPFVVASGAGKLAQEDGEASEGFWHGYTLVRLAASGDPREMIVEQRPVFDWLRIEGSAHVLRPGQRMTLRGIGREPVGMAASGWGYVVREDRIDSPAVTHRYDLLEADPGKPWIPRRGADGDYVPLDPSIATVDAQTGRVRAGRGNHPRAYAIALLSVGEHVASYPLVFEPRRSFVPRQASVLRQPPLRPVVLSQPPAPPPPPPAAPPQSSVPAVQPPLTPPPPAAPPTAAPPTPLPTPQAPPAPPAQQAPTPIDLAAQPVGLTIAPAASVIPPPAPPIQPAPPGGARREARQRQAATAKSEEGAAGTKASDSRGDLADELPSGGAMTRRDRVRPAASITALERREQPSAWARGALYGGGLTLAAVVLAAGWLTLRPTPRRRPPEVPAPATALTRGRWNGR